MVGTVSFVVRMLSPEVSVESAKPPKRKGNTSEQERPRETKRDQERTRENKSKHERTRENKREHQNTEKGNNLIRDITLQRQRYMYLESYI